MEKREIRSTFYEYKDLSEVSRQHQQLIQEAQHAASKAYAPYSEFFVGAAVLLENGEIIQASNQENSAYPSGLCAERTAVFYANSKYPDSPVRLLAIAAMKGGKPLNNPIPPCGSCLQVLLESERRHQASIQVILYGSQKILVAENVEQFLPFGFTPLSLSAE